MSQREILFRAWSPKWKKMIHSDSDYSIDVHAKTVWRDTADDESAVLMQFTGLTDKNGVKIFESDRIFHHKHQKEFVVTWNQDGCGWSLGDMALSKLCIPNLEVVGNIHEL